MMYPILVCATGVRCRWLYPAVTVLQGAAGTHTPTLTHHSLTSNPGAGLALPSPSKAKASHSYTADVVFLPPSFPLIFFILDFFAGLAYHRHEFP
jgi:hypothetical protein